MKSSGRFRFTAARVAPDRCPDYRKKFLDMNDLAVKVLFFILLPGFWLLLSSEQQVFIWAPGVVSAVLVVALLARMDIIDKRSPLLGSFFRRSEYPPWLRGRSYRV